MRPAVNNPYDEPEIIQGYPGMPQNQYQHYIPQPDDSSDEDND
jgi:hypothetical protein